jgi:hypothetical protein
MFKESLKRVRMSISVGNVVRSVGFGTYSEMSKIKTARAIEIVRSTSKRADGRGTIMIARIAITKTTTLKSL